MHAIYLSTDAAAPAGGLGMSSMLIWLVVMVAIMYFLMIRPQRNEQKRINAMLADMAVGDSVVTTGGFYGVILDITDDDVIVEFGNNKNCRIPMRKSAIAQVEKASDSYSAEPVKEETKPSLFGFGKKKDSAKTEDTAASKQEEK